MVALPEHHGSPAWEIVRMESLSWLNMAISAIILAGALLLDLPGWTFWTAAVVAPTVIALEVFDEWAERRGLAQEVVGPESVILVAALWLVGTVLVVGAPASFVAIAVIGGLLVAAASLLNALSSFRLDTTPGRREDE